MWLRIKDNKPPAYNKWTDEDEQKLLKLRTEEVYISETALGRAMGTSKREMAIVFPKLPKRQRTEILDMLGAKHSELNQQSLCSIF